MLGQLLEFSVCARPLAGAVEAFTALGFRDVPVGDIVGTPYAVVADDRLALGLHDLELDGLAATFVRPDLEHHVRALRRRGVEFEFLELADDGFHRAGFVDPGGQLVVLLEARTFSPVRVREPSACGGFVELSVATRALEESLAFWAALDFTVVARGDTPHEWVRLAGAGLTIGLHDAARFRSALTFRAGSLEARVEYLRAKGFELRSGTPLTPGGADSATLRPPADVEFFLLSADDAAEGPAE